jgi:exoribonuclease R
LLWGGKGATPDYGKMQELAEHLGHTERSASEAEMQSRKIKELAYFQKIIKSPKPTLFKAMVSKALRVGLFVEVTEIFTKGIVRADALEEAGYYFDANTERYLKRKGGGPLTVGSVLDVVPIFIEQERGSVAFRLADKQSPASSVSGRPTDGKSGGGKPGGHPSSNRSGPRKR